MLMNSINIERGGGVHWQGRRREAAGLLAALVVALRNWIGRWRFLLVGYEDVFAFVLLVLILIFRPSGLLGRRVNRKV